MSRAPERPAPIIRTAAKALIVRERAVLLIECRFDGETVYILPGGGQLPGEALDATVRREVLEETGLHVRVDGLLWMREFIAHNHRPGLDDGLHAVEAIFRCTSEEGGQPGAGALPDDAQVGVRWVPLAALAALTLWPETVKRLLLTWAETGVEPHPAYLGDCP